jgi:hypothetical protein
VFTSIEEGGGEMKIRRKKMFAIVGAIIAGGFGIAIASVPQAAHAGVAMN